MDCSDDGCPTAAVMFGTETVRVLAAGEVDGELHLLVETTERIEGVPVLRCRHGRAPAPGHLLRDAPFGHRPVVVMWRKPIFRCAETVVPGGHVLARTTHWPASGRVDPADDHLGRGRFGLTFRTSAEGYLSSCLSGSLRQREHSGVVGRSHRRGHPESIDTRRPSAPLLDRSYVPRDEGTPC